MNIVTREYLSSQSRNFQCHIIFDSYLLTPVCCWKSSFRRKLQIFHFSAFLRFECKFCFLELSGILFCFSFFFVEGFAWRLSLEALRVKHHSIKVVTETISELLETKLNFFYISIRAHDSKSFFFDSKSYKSQISVFTSSPQTTTEPELNTERLIYLRIAFIMNALTHSKCFFLRSWIY